MTKAAFIVNPGAGKRSEAYRARLRRLARKRLGEVMIYMTRVPDEAGRLAIEAVDRGAGLLVCVGGDGTLNEVVNGVMTFDRTTRSRISLALIPNGTGCDFARSLSIPADPQKALAIIAKGKVRSLDIGTVVYADHSGNRRFRYFHNVVSFGLGGEVAGRVNRSKKTLGPRLSFLWATLFCVFRYNTKEVFVEGETNGRNYRIWNVAVGNGRYHGSGMLVAPDALPDDGLLHTTVIGGLTIPDVLLNLPRLYNGRITRVKGVRTFSGRRFFASSPERVFIEIDGEPCGRLPVEVGLSPLAINFIVP